MNTSSSDRSIRRRVVFASSIVVVGALALLAIGNGALAGPLALLEELQTHEKQQQFRDTKSFQGNDLTMASPDWLPADATSIRFRIKTDGPGNAVELTSPSAPSGCTRTPETARSDMAVSWLPDQGGAGWRCDGDWWVQRTTTGLAGWTSTTARHGSPDRGAGRDAGGSVV